ncbi:MAG: hypothetical protein M1548_02015, partial [Actinobacteria bacterium]|nr:hypothetical protein [Actinomycetota bacterium]
EANFKFIEQAVNFLHSISEVGAVIFQDELAKLGQVTGPGMKRHGWRRRQQRAGHAQRHSRHGRVQAALL